MESCIITWQPRISNASARVMSQYCYKMLGRSSLLSVFSLRCMLAHDWMLLRWCWMSRFSLSKGPCLWKATRSFIQRSIFLTITPESACHSYSVFHRSINQDPHRLVAASGFLNIAEDSLCSIVRRPNISSGWSEMQLNAKQHIAWAHLWQGP